MSTFADIFDAFPSGDDLEQAAVDTLDAWWQVYSREYELQHGLDQDALPLPERIIKSERLDHENADSAMPTVVVVTPGMAPGRRPARQGDGVYRCWYTLGVGVFVSGQDRETTNTLLRQYTAIIKALMMQRQDLNGYGNGLTLLDESWDDNFRFSDTETLGVGQVVFEAEVEGGNRYGGPEPGAVPAPDTQPGSDWPVATNVNVSIEVKES